MATWTGDMTELGIALSALAEPRKTGEFPPTNRHDRAAAQLVWTHPGAPFAWCKPQDVVFRIPGCMRK
jgi:hypothetical protein